MRVFLKSMAGPMATAAPRDEPARTNGNGGAHGPGEEASAFRELLTEFRNLTERYGQALLALGEARGEVAGLRSRVELLEARLDFRLPASSEPAPLASETPVVDPARPEPPSPAAVAPARTTMAKPASPRRTSARPKRATAKIAPVRRKPSRPRTPPSTRSAMIGFADALARAQDPAVADVGDALPTEEAIAGANLEVASEGGFEPGAPVGDVADELLRAGDANSLPEVTTPDEIASLSDEASSPPEAVLDESDAAPATYTTAVVEPDWFADGDFAWLDAADVEARGEAAATLGSEAADAPESQPEPDLAFEAQPLAEASFVAADEVTPDAEMDSGAELGAEPAPMADVDLAAAEPMAEGDLASQAEPMAEGAVFLDAEPMPDADLAAAPMAEGDLASQVEPIAEGAVFLDAEPIAEAAFVADAGMAPHAQMGADAEFAAEPAPMATADFASAAQLIVDAAVLPDAEPMVDAESTVDAEPMAEAAFIDDAETAPDTGLGAEPEISADAEPIAEAAPAASAEPASPALATGAGELDADPATEPEIAPQSVAERPPPLLAGPAAEPDVDLAAEAAEPEPEPIAADEVPIESLDEPELEPAVPTTPEPAGFMTQAAALGLDLATARDAESGGGAIEPAQPPEVKPKPEPHSPAGASRPVDQARVEAPAFEEEELMWLGTNREDDSELETPSASSPGAEPASALRNPPGALERPNMETPPGTGDARPPLAMTEEELAQLARAEGWDEAEVTAIRAMIWRPSAPGVELPGAAELDEAMAALHAVPVEAEADPERPAARAATGGDEPAADDWAIDEPSPPPPRVGASGDRPRPPTADPDWTRGRKGPAASAYRRLRRLFPG